MRLKICILSLLSMIFISAEVGDAQEGASLSLQNAGCDTLIKPEVVKGRIYIYRILAPEDRGSSPIRVSSYRDSCRVIITEVPYQGYYILEVEAGYSTGSQTHEEYRLRINRQTLGPIVPDTVVSEPSPGHHTYVWRNHGVQYLDHAGDDTITFHKGCQRPEDGPNSVHFKTIKITCLPYILPEPRYTSGLSNTVHWIPNPVAYDHEVVCFDSSTGSFCKPLRRLQRSFLSDANSTTFEDLEDGHTYGYYVIAYYDGNKDTTDTTYSTQDASPPTEVKIDSILAFRGKLVEIYWKGACDSVSGVTFYRIYRFKHTRDATKLDTVIQIQAKIYGEPVKCDTNSYSYQDTLAEPPDMSRSYCYQIGAVDIVENERIGPPSNRVVLLSPPEIVICDSIYASNLIRYVKGSKITICAEVSGSGVCKPDFVKFQAVRDSLKFFSSQWQPGQKFFDTGWLPITNSVCYTFDFGDSAFVNGHKYFYRARFKDKQGNYSLWSDTLSVIHDCFPPSDIFNLSVTPMISENNTKGWMQLKWGAAFDAVSGLRYYKIYRKKDTAYECIAVLNSNETYYADSFESIGVNVVVYYKVGSVDHVGNERDTSMTLYQASARCAIGPKIKWVADTTKAGISKEDHAYIFISLDYDTTQVLKYVANITRPIRGDTTVEKERKGDFMDFFIRVDLPDTGRYVAKVRAIFMDKSISTWSKPDTLVKVDDTIPKFTTPIVKTCALKQNYPNPFNLQTMIPYQLPENGWVSINIYNIQGRKVATLVNERKQAGLYTVSWDGTDNQGHKVASGIYFCQIHIRIKEQLFHEVRRMLLLK